MAIPVLMYHHINVHKGDIVTVRPEIFKEQMKLLKAAGIKTLKADELISYIKGGITADIKAAVLTFDDGWLDNHINVLPVLKEYDLNAVIFIITDRAEEAGAGGNDTQGRIPTHEESKKLIAGGDSFRVALDWKLIKEMSETGLVEFYSHTKSHRRCAELSVAELAEELKGSKEVMEQRLQRPCPYLCWPYGSYNETSIEIAKEAGYSALFTVDHGVVRTGDDPFSIKRIDVQDSISWFRETVLSSNRQGFSDE
ncbi:MAG: polysaccharide deacetylase family protein [Thermodesulfovibrionia bacterium]|nr:polysaccharide deacetylase family protein [Thermodesulfovibrionia bacterium]